MNKLQEYLDDSITVWRRKRDTAENNKNRWTAICYVDAFQSVRISMFGSVLPTEDGGDVVADMADEHFRYLEDANNDAHNAWIATRTLDLLCEQNRISDQDRQALIRQAYLEFESNKLPIGG